MAQISTVDFFSINAQLLEYEDRELFLKHLSKVRVLQVGVWRDNVGYGFSEASKGVVWLR